MVLIHINESSLSLSLSLSLFSSLLLSSLPDAQQEGRKEVREGGLKEARFPGGYLESLAALIHIHKHLIFCYSFSFFFYFFTGCATGRKEGRKEVEVPASFLSLSSLLYRNS